MSDEISFFCNDDIEQHVQKVMSQTNYTKEKAKEKLRLFNCDYMRVIRDYMGIPETKEEKKVKSLNQEIFRQIRTKMDVSMKEYRDKNPINIEQVIQNLNEEEENKLKNNVN